MKEQGKLPLSDLHWRRLSLINQPVSSLAHRTQVSMLPGPTLTQAEFEQQKQEYRHHEIVCYCTAGVRSGALTLKRLSTHSSSVRSEVVSPSDQAFSCGFKRSTDYFCFVSPNRHLRTAADRPRLQGEQSGVQHLRLGEDLKALPDSP